MNARRFEESAWILRQSNLRSCGARTEASDDAGMSFAHHAAMLARLQLWNQVWLLPGSTKLVFNTGDSFAQLANFALCSHLASQNGILQCCHQGLLVSSYF